jgi:hypothetical protein
MLKIFHAPRSRSHRIVWLCEEMGVPSFFSSAKRVWRCTAIRW